MTPPPAIPQSPTPPPAVSWPPTPEAAADAGVPEPAMLPTPPRQSRPPAMPPPLPTPPRQSRPPAMPPPLPTPPRQSRPPAMPAPLQSLPPQSPPPQSPGQPPRGPYSGRGSLDVDRLTVRLDGFGDSEARRLAALVGNALGRLPLGPGTHGDLAHLALEVPAIAGESTERLAERVAAAIVARAAQEVARR